MQIPSTIRAALGPTWVPVRAPARVTLTRGELFAAILQIERDADAALAAGDDHVATCPDWRAVDLAAL
jgi:hypothetical protein